ncbi:hypothetical protein KORDIASMS9_01383 [Kordia sp. SMS9]|uniref:hypothetical protein n=1 Tax=Kordia sp. SMS9 TaxID=2282170 RepID=UPI000E0D2369|nr:hypothetical protein [Kordia sp. SMS9]AXG69164.1 hypothetical protein KORDIASMS9_01383 [Kordia sp. SMS9]
MRYIFSILILVFASSIVLSQELKIVDRDGFSIAFPSNWEEKEMPGHLIYIMESDKESEGYLLTLGVQVTKEKETLEEFIKRYEHDLLNNTTYKDCKIELKKEISSGGKKGMRYFCHAIAAHIPIEIISFAIEHDGQIILTTATAFWLDPSKKTTDFILLFNTIEKILNSIKVA